ncbi:MAG: amidase family protein [Pseudomonadota bacterium]|nr:amidase family protein [Pseudomonadota bacterium]
MSPKFFYNRNLVELAELLFSGEVNSSEIAKEVIVAAENHSDLNLFVDFDAARLIKIAKEKDRENKLEKNRKPLSSIPLLIKDNINTFDMPTSGGTPALKQNVCASDAPVVSRLRAAGAIIAGKANLHELSLGGTSNNATFGAVGNPFDSDYVPGGSSGGTAAAVAAGVVSAGLGTDTAGSVRVPAALCGVVGFRPTTGRYPIEGVVPVTQSYDTVGSIAQTVEDVTLIDSILANQTLKEINYDLNKVRLGIPNDSFLEASSFEVQLAFDRAIGKLVDAGAELEQINLSEIISLGEQASLAIMECEYVPVMRSYLAEYGHGLSLEVLAEQIASPTVKQIIQLRLKQEFDAVIYSESINNMIPRLQFLHRDLFQRKNLDALIFPTTPESALPRDVDDKILRNGKSTFAWLYFTHTLIASAAGNPSLTLPIVLNQSALPVGISLDGLRGQDSDLLALGNAVEKVLNQ